MTLDSPRRAVWVAAGLGFCAGIFFLSRLAENLPKDEGKFFLLLSPLVAAVAAMVQSRATSGSHGRRLGLGIAVAALGLGVLASLALDARFVVRVEDASGSTATIIGWERRDEDCVCPAERDRDCPKELRSKAAREQGEVSAKAMLDAWLDACWPERDLIELALKLAHFLILIGLGGVAGLRRVVSEEQSIRDDHYLDLHVRIDSGEGDAYTVNALTLKGSSQHRTFTLPGYLQELEPGSLGGELFEAVFGGDVLRVLCVAREQARNSKRGLRIRLELQNAPRLAPLPWEFLYDRQGGGFLALSCETPVVRGLEKVEPYPCLEVEPPLRVLLTTAQPATLEALDVEREVDNIERALEPLIKKRLVDLQRVRSGFWEDVSMRSGTAIDSTSSTSSAMAA